MVTLAVVGVCTDHPGLQEEVLFKDHTGTPEEATPGDHTVVLSLADLSVDTGHTAVTGTAVDSTWDIRDMVIFCVCKNYLGKFFKN